MAQEKPYPDFPLFRHQNGQWAKKIRQKLYYFGTDWQKALKEYCRVRDDLQAGREPIVNRDGLTVFNLVNLFLEAKMLLVEAGELSIRTWQTYKATSDTLREAFGNNASVGKLRPVDFETLRAKLAAVRPSAVALGNEVQRVRSIFKYAHDTRLIPYPVVFGPTFKKPPKKLVRQQKHANGPRMFHASEIRKIIYAAPLQLKAMTLLAVNCGFGQSDVSSLPISAICDGWVEFPRPKTAVHRRCPLWAETREAVDEVLKSRRKPRRTSDGHLVFLTRCGQRWVRASEKGIPIDNITIQFTKLLNDLKIKRSKINFYSLRHTFATIGNEAKDPLAVDWIMGHAAQDMGGNYREMISDERLLAVTEAVHCWLFPRPWVAVG